MLAASHPPLHNKDAPNGFICFLTFVADDAAGLRLLLHFTILRLVDVHSWRGGVEGRGFEESKSEQLAGGAFLCPPRAKLDNT